MELNEEEHIAYNNLMKEKSNKIGVTPLSNKTEIDIILDKVKLAYETAIKKHTIIKANSPHEVLGLLTEEYHEYLNEIKNNDLDRQETELYDIIVTAIFGIYSKKHFVEQTKKFGEVKKCKN